MYKPTSFTRSFDASTLEYKKTSDGPNTVRFEMTLELMDAWIEALESGEYIQGFFRLITGYESIEGRESNHTHCCIGVLGDMLDTSKCEIPTVIDDITLFNHSELSKEKKLDSFQVKEIRMYSSVESVKGLMSVSDIWRANDKGPIASKDISQFKGIDNPEQRDYSNILPLLRKLRDDWKASLDKE